MFKKSFNILKDNMIFIQPLLIWQIVSAGILYVSVNRHQEPVIRGMMYISALLLFIVCLAGWFYINKCAVLSYNEDDSDDKKAEKSIQNIRKFFEGAGGSFLRIFAACVVLFILYAASLYGIFYAGAEIIGIPDFIKEIADAGEFKTNEQLMKYLSSISGSDRIIFAEWTAVITCLLSVLNFFSLLYFAAMNFERKNFIISFFDAVKFFFVNLFDAARIIIFMSALWLLINLLSAAAGSNAVMLPLLIILMTLYFNYYVLLVFCCYYDKTGKAGKTENSGGNGSDGIREDYAGSEAGTEV